jgi:DNA-3-methyladenine glycosylase II
MTSPVYWDDAKAHLSRRDKKLGKIIASYQGEALTLKGDPFFTLARSIAGQQISVKAADSVWRKFEASVKKVKPEVVLETDVATLRAAGLSNSKVVYMHALAQHFIDNKKLIRRWPEMSDEEITKELVSIKGIGKWTAEMFLIFHLGRPDVFPIADLGLQKGIFRHYNASEKMHLDEVRKLGERWKPYRSVATWYLWRSLDPVPVEY